MTEKKSGDWVYRAKGHKCNVPDVGTSAIEIGDVWRCRVCGDHWVAIDNPDAPKSISLMRVRGMSAPPSPFDITYPGNAWFSTTYTRWEK